MTKHVAYVASGLLGLALLLSLASGTSMARSADALAVQQPDVPIAALPVGMAASPSPGYKLVVQETGLYELSYSDLAAAELPVDTLDPATFQIFYHDQETAIYVAGQGDGSFDSGDYLLFYGEALSGQYLKYTGDNVYWLTYGHESGLRMPEEDDGTPTGSSVPATFQDAVHLEEDLKYWSEMSGGDDDFARWRGTTKYAPGDIIKTPTLDSVAPSTVDDPLMATIRVAMYGYYDSSASPDQHVLVHVNGYLVGELEWDGISAYQAEFEFDQGYLYSGTEVNTIWFELIQNQGVGVQDSATALDWFEIEYQRLYRAAGNALIHSGDVTGDIEVDGFTADAYLLASTEERAHLTTFDVTDPLLVRRVLNTLWEESDPGYYRVRFADTTTGVQRYWTGLPAARLSPVSVELDSPSDLGSTVLGADYIMISHGDFLSEVAPLRDYYNQNTDLATVLVDVQDVYDEFSGGVFYPGAIRDFLYYAYHNAVGDPLGYVLLVGDGHYDFKNITGTTLGQYIPPYLSYVDPVLGETIVDNRYVCVDGDDTIPDIALGRFPVNSPEEAAIMVNKSINYQEYPTSGGWDSNMLFVADNPDGAGDFYWFSNDIIENWVPDTYTTTQIYYGTAEYPLTTGIAQAREDIITNISDGQLFVSYTGHSAISWWATEQLLQASNVSSLANGGMLPIMLPMTCTEGYFGHPDTRVVSLSETLVRADGGGAIASFAPTGWGASWGHHYLQRGFFDAIYNQGIVRLGDITDYAKQYLWDNAPDGAYRDLLDTYVLLGDPALTINVGDLTGVELAAFTAQADLTGSVVLEWETITEVGTVGFNLYRAQAGGGERLQLNPSLILSNTPPGSPAGATYEYVDDGAEAGVTFDYWLEEIDTHGVGRLYGPVRVSVPAVFRPEFRLWLPLIQRQQG